MDEIKLKASEKATLLALYKVCDGSLGAHPPIEAVESKFKRHERHVPKKAMKALCRIGLASPHPTGGGKTYNITRDGKEYVETYMNEYLQKWSKKKI